MKPNVYETSDFTIRCIRYNRENDFLNSTKIMRKDVYDIFYADEAITDVELVLKISGDPNKLKEAIEYYLKNRQPNTISITAEPGYIMGSGLMLIVDMKKMVKRESDILKDIGFAQVFWGKDMTNTAGSAFVYCDDFSEPILQRWDNGNIAKEIKYNKSKSTKTKTKQKKAK